MLAQRTQKLIEELEPDTVLVQTSQRWWEQASRLKYVESQEELNGYAKKLDSHCDAQTYDFYYSNRKWLSAIRFYLYANLFKFHFMFSNWRFARPGLEMKFACEAAQNVGARLEFMGSEFDQRTWQRLLHETRFNVPDYFIRRFQRFGTFWGREIRANRQKLNSSGYSAFSEKCLDARMMNWFIQSTDAYFPQIKRVFIDMKDEDLFRDIDACKGQRIVVVVNQWHMEGIEHHWAHRYGQVPRSVEIEGAINPIGDMNLREGLFQRLYNNLHREIASRNVGAGPSTYADWIIGYHRESNF